MAETNTGSNQVGAEAGGEPASAVPPGGALPTNPPGGSTNTDGTAAEGAGGGGDTAGAGGAAGAQGGGNPAGGSNSDNKGMVAPATCFTAKDPLGPGPFGLNDFDTGVTLGTGSFGRVRIATHTKTQTPWAIKALKKAEIVRMQQVRPGAAAVVRD